MLKVLGVLFIFLLSAFDVQADGFATKKFTQLEAQIRQQFTLEDIAKLLSDLNGFDKWQERITPEYRLYVAICWLDQNHALQAANLLSQTTLAEDWQDLKKYYLAVAMMNLYRYSDAEKYLNELEMAYKDDADILYLRGLDLTAAGRLIEAIDVMDRLVKTDARNGKAYLQRGVLHLIALSHELAIKDFKKALQLLPKYDSHHRQQAYLQAGIIYYKFLNNHKKAEEFIEKGMKLNPNSELVAQMKEVLR